MKINPENLIFATSEPGEPVDPEKILSEDKKSKEPFILTDSSIGDHLNIIGYNTFDLEKPVVLNLVMERKNQENEETNPYRLFIYKENERKDYLVGYYEINIINDSNEDSENNAIPKGTIKIGTISEERILNIEEAFNQFEEDKKGGLLLKEIMHNMKVIESENLDT